jgi:3-phosphoshikimate 1-carboxyvinyltransferase
MERSFDPGEIRGTVQAPASKSMTQRAIAAAVLATGNSTLWHPSYCDDALAAMSIAAGLGAKVEPDPEKLKIQGSAILKETKLNCGESGLAIRMFSPIAALYPSEIIMSGAVTLKKRPMSMIAEALEQLGAECKTSEGYLPITIKGPMQGGNCTIDGSVSSQLLTGLLMALPLAENDSEIKVNNLKSRPYIDMTLEILEKFGIEIQNQDYQVFRIKGMQNYSPSDVMIEGDWSGGAFLLVAGAINGDILVKGLKENSLQSDKAIFQALKSAGAAISFNDEGLKVTKSNLRAFDFDATHSPDLFPPLVTMAAYCDGVSKIKGVSRLTFKESNRAETLKEEFGKINVKVEINDDIMSVTGSRPQGARVESHEDHRIAMAMAVAALKSSGRIILRDSQCIAKSYPDFYKDMRHLGAIINE